MVILREFRNNILKQNYSKAENSLFDYGEELEKQGWINDMMEGGYISPDLSTIFYYNRIPYKGQLIQFRPNIKDKFDKIVESLKEDFIILEGK